MMPLWLKKSLLGSISTIVFFVGCEIGVRFFFPQADNIYTGDAVYFWSLKPNLDRQVDKQGHSFRLQSNELGMRGRDVASEGNWLFLGCSTTMGWGVEDEEGFVYAIGERLQIPAINGGQPGWSTHQAILGLERFKNINVERVFIGFGVRDAQLSNRLDKNSRPVPWVFSLRLVQLAKQLRPTVVKEPTINRVPVEDFTNNLGQIRDSFGEAKVQLYAFPQATPNSEYDAVIKESGGWIFPQFDKNLFFLDDPIHLNAAGHKHLTELFIAKIADESKQKLQ